MSNLYFRVFDRKACELYYVEQITFQYHKDSIEIGFYDTNGCFHEGFSSQFHLQAGIKIEGQIIYEGDIIATEGYADTEVIFLDHLLQIGKIEKKYKIVGNIYEGRKTK